jgi:hypothetical protein
MLIYFVLHKFILVEKYPIVFVISGSITLRGDAVHCSRL